jgi:hypothetical protein
MTGNGLKKPIPSKAPQMAKEQGRAVSAPSPSPNPAKPATAQMRKPWRGKYDDLAKLTKETP